MRYPEVREVSRGERGIQRYIRYPAIRDAFRGETYSEVRSVLRGRKVWRGRARFGGYSEIRGVFRGNRGTCMQR